MALVIDIMDGHGLSNRAHCKNLSKKTINITLSFHVVRSRDGCL